MQTIIPDFNRKIDLPGVGPCPRPVDIDQSVTAFADLVSLRIYSFTIGSVIDGEAEGDEVYMVLLTGAAEAKISGTHNARFALSESGTRAVYLPPGHAYHLTLTDDADIAYARAVPAHPNTPKGFSASAGDIILADPGHADKLHMCLASLRKGTEQDANADNRELLVFSTGEFSANGTDHAEWTTLALASRDRVTLSPKSDALVLTISA